MKRAYRFRFYPTAEQASVLNRTFGCARFAWNHVLAERHRRWHEEGLSTATNTAAGYRARHNH